MAKQFVKELYRIWIAERPNQLAAALAYYSMFSFAPIIFLAVSIVGIFIREINLAEQFYQRLESLFGVGVSDLVRGSVAALSTSTNSGSLLVSLISFLAMLFAASGLFYQLQYTLNIIWRVPPPHKGETMVMLRQRFLSFLIVIGIGLLGVLAAFANLVLTWFGSILERILGLVGSQVFFIRLAAPVVLVLIIALLYKMLPEAKGFWKDVWLGAVVAATLILATILLAGFFFQFISFNSALQTTGAFTILLVGFYFFAQIFLLGALCCRVYAGYYGSRRSLPQSEASG